MARGLLIITLLIVNSWLPFIGSSISISALFLSIHHILVQFHDRRAHFECHFITLTQSVQMSHSVIPLHFCLFHPFNCLNPPPTIFHLLLISKQAPYAPRPPPCRGAEALTCCQQLIAELLWWRIRNFWHFLGAPFLSFMQASLSTYSVLLGSSCILFVFNAESEIPFRT